MSKIRQDPRQRPTTLLHKGNFEKEDEKQGTKVINQVALPVNQRQPRIDVSCYPQYCFDFLIASKNHLMLMTGGSEASEPNKPCIEA